MMPGWGTVVIYFLVIFLGACPLVLLGWGGITAARNGDRPGDARVSALLGTGADGGSRLIFATVRNPSGAPALTALRVRRGLVPGSVAGQLSVRVPRWTRGRRFRPAAYETVGVVPAGGAAEFPVPVPCRAHRYVLTVAVGQRDGRLRVYRLRLAGTDIYLGKGEVRAPLG
jgi:hypothetical protein